MSRPPAGGFCDSIVFNEPNTIPTVASLIGVLFLASRPSTIFWCIVSVIIDSINRMSRGWTTPHIFKKVFVPMNRSYPPFANRNTAATISVISTVFLVVAPRLHRRPGTILSGSFTEFVTGLAMCFGVKSVFFTYLSAEGREDFFLPTTTRFYIPTFHAPIPCLP